MTTEEKLKALILSRYSTLTAFADASGLKYQTINSILQRGINNAGVSNIITICQTLGLSVEELSKGNFVYVKSPDLSTPLEDLTSILEIQLREGNVTFEGLKLSQDETDLINDTIEFMVHLLQKKRSRK